MDGRWPLLDEAAAVGTSDVGVGPLLSDGDGDGDGDGEPVGEARRVVSLGGGPADPDGAVGVAALSALDRPGAGDEPADGTEASGTPTA